MASLALALWAVGLAGEELAQTIPENVSDLPSPRDTGTWRPNPDDPVPIMAYYYIWFDPQSWERAKTDYPLVGRYSSDDEAVMEHHVRLAKGAGIDGFIVSWKSTLNLDRRLEQLMEIARREDFYLWIIYQGLDFDRRPRDLELIANDLDFFLERYADHPAFAMYNLPVLIWSGTWEFETPAIRRFAEAYRDRIYLLATERSAKAYGRLADTVDGNAYYWSSVDPEATPGYEDRLRAMGDLVHERGGLWVAPAAPGFDARLVGGTRVIDRRGGETLRRQLAAALRSSPDAVGLISWNEFSENTHVEPSQRYGSVALDTLADREVSMAPQILDFDSSAPGVTDRAEFYGLTVLAGTVAFISVCVALLAVRIRRDKVRRRLGAPSDGSRWTSGKEYGK